MAVWGVGCRGAGVFNASGVCAGARQCGHATRIAADRGGVRRKKWRASLLLSLRARQPMPTKRARPPDGAPALAGPPVEETFIVLSDDDDDAEAGAAAPQPQPQPPRTDRGVKASARPARPSGLPALAPRRHTPAQAAGPLAAAPAAPAAAATDADVRSALWGWGDAEEAMALSSSSEEGEKGVGGRESCAFSARRKKTQTTQPPSLPFRLRRPRPGQAVHCEGRHPEREFFSFGGRESEPTPQPFSLSPGNPASSPFFHFFSSSRSPASPARRRTATTSPTRTATTSPTQTATTPKRPRAPPAALHPSRRPSVSWTVTTSPPAVAAARRRATGAAPQP